MKRFFKIILFAGMLLIGVASLAIYWTFYRPLPDYQSTTEMAGLQNDVEIKWDKYGVPHIYAQNKQDLYHTVGYVHAQDRLWQMTIAQMAAEGRFAEFFGKDLLNIDKMQRTIGFWRVAEKIETQLPDSTRQILQAYADGVNKYIQNHKKELPPQFALAGISPIKWTPMHTLAISRLMAWELNLAWKTELIYTVLFNELSTGQFSELFPNSKISTNLPEVSRGDSSLTHTLSALLKLQASYAKIRGSQGLSTGSNAWAVDGSKSSSGKALLAGDPHLGLGIPGKWYEVHLNVDGKNLSGATLPGVPSVVLGQNDVLAWSLTNVMLDDTDFFKERIHPNDSNQYLLDSLAGEPVYEKFTEQRELIKVKNSDDITFTRRLTKHGPVITDIYPYQQLTEGKIITMQWTGLEPTMDISALQQMGWASSFNDFKNGVKQFKNPAQNFIYADTAGNIARFTAAHVPIRDGNPIILRKGWQPQLDWKGYVNFDELPHTINPNNGWVGNANNPIVDDAYPYYLSVYWQPQSRYRRIEEYLSNNDNLSLEAFQIMQNDTYSSYARAVTRIIIPALQSDPDSSFTTAVSYLQNWDYTYQPSETAASIMDMFILQLSKNTFRDEMGGQLYDLFISYSAKPARILKRMLENGSPFFDDTNTPQTETRPQIIRQSMQQTLDELRGKLGPDPSQWRWGNLHTLTLRPPFLSQAAAADDASSSLKMIVKNVFNRGPFPAGGHALSLNNGGYLWSNPFDMGVGASIRRLVDLGTNHRSLSILPTGQSGNPLSEFYGDQTDSWLNGQYKFLYQDSSAFKEHATTTLTPKK